MRQLLMLGFYCEVYRREPICRVYIDNVLVDEFNIPRAPRTDKYTNQMQLDPKYPGYDMFISQSSPCFTKLIEFEDFDSKSLDLRVEVKNDDNNYSNGFMNKYTKVMLSHCCLLSIKLCEKIDKILDRWKFSQHKFPGDSRSVLMFYRGLRNYIFNNLAEYAEMHFPDITQQLQLKEQAKLIYSNYQDLPQMWQDSPNKHWVGTSGYFHLTLAKKLGFWRHSTDRRRGWWKCVQNSNEKNLINKYRNNEDKRNTDQ